jgi:hypothetical protein
MAYFFLANWQNLQLKEKIFLYEEETSCSLNLVQHSCIYNQNLFWVHLLMLCFPKMLTSPFFFSLSL